MAYSELKCIKNQGKKKRIKQGSKKIARHSQRTKKEVKKERKTGLEPATSTLARWHSTTELLSLGLLAEGGT